MAQKTRYYKQDGTEYDFSKSSQIKIIQTSNADMNIGIHEGIYIDGRKDYGFIIESPLDEVARIHYTLFQKPYKKQKAVLRLLIWFSIKHYFKILFK